MVAPQLFDNEAQSAPSPPPAAPPPSRFRRGLLAAVAALAIAGGAGSGAVAATIVDHNTQASTAAATTANSTSSTATSTQASTTAQSIYQQVSPGVVTITATVSSGPRGSGQAVGSGIVLDTNGNILTNAHVIAGARQIQVTFSNGQTANATLVGSNTSADLAVIRVSVAASSLQPVTLGNSDSVRVGDAVYAIGSPFGLSGSLSQGIVSNLKQSGATSVGNLSGLIQTDAAINPGNSGGPLVNAQGEVIGINTSIESPVDGNVGVGFAIPMNQVKQLLSALEGGSNL
jgi:S1-C subfamily serine protease